MLTPTEGFTRFGSTRANQRTPDTRRRFRPVNDSSTLGRSFRRGILALNDEYFIDSEVTLGRITIPGVNPFEVAADLVLADLHWKFRKWWTGEPFARRIADLPDHLPMEVGRIFDKGVWQCHHWDFMIDRWLRKAIGSDRTHELAPDVLRPT